MTRSGAVLAAVAVVAIGYPRTGPAETPSLLRSIADDQARTAAAVRAVAAAALTGGRAPLDDVLTESTPGADTLRAPLEVLAAIREPVAGRGRRLDDVVEAWTGPHGDRVRAHLDASDTLRAAAGLLRDERHDRWAAAVNDTVRPFGVGTNLLAFVNPVLLAGSAIDSIWTAISHIRHRDRVTPRQREALVALSRAAESAPRGRLAGDAARTARVLDTRVMQARCRALARAAATAMDAGRIAAATYLLRSPNATGCDRDLHDLRRRATALRATRDEARKAAAWPAPEPRLPRTRAEWEAYAALARATVRPDPAAMVLAARRLTAGWPDSPNAPAAALAVAVARARAGHPTSARAALEVVAKDGGPGAWAARNCLATFPEAQATIVRQAERQHARNVARYVLLGAGPSPRGALRAAAHAGAQGAAGLPALGITNMIGILTRGVLAWRRDPAANDAIIAEGERYLARYPHGPEANPVRRDLVRAYERSRRWDRALLHYQALPDPDPDVIRRLENEIADEMFARAAANPADPTLLRAIVEQYPASRAADRARPILAARGNGAVVPISRHVLEEAPDLLGATGLGLPPGLLDGDLANGELDDAGIRVTAHAIECVMRGRGDHPGTTTVAIAERDAPRVFATLAELGRRYRAAHPDDEGDGSGRFEDWIPFFVQGAVGDGGIALRPGIKLRAHESPHPERYQ